MSWPCLLLLLWANSAWAGGLSAWEEPTPYGHSMYHDGSAGGWVYMQVDTVSVAFQHFYFYQQHTIADSDSSYLIIDEANQRVQQFKSESEWQRQLAQQHLVPLLKRSYGSSYSSAFGDGTFFLLILLPFPLLMPLLWLGCLISLPFFGRKLYRFRLTISWLYPAICLVAVLLSVFPQSF